MRASVRANFVRFNSPLEGVLPFPYLDVLGYVTTGMGNLIDPVSTALGLPWEHLDGSPCSQAEIVAAWQAVDACRTAPKGQRQPSGLATKYGGAFEHVTNIRLTHDGIFTLVGSKMMQNETYLKRYFPTFDAQPADVQMCLHSMAWAMGPAFGATFVHFRAAIADGRYADAAPLSTFRGAGVANRIAQDEKLLHNAQIIKDRGLNPDALWWPRDLTDAAQLSAALAQGIGVS